MFCAAVESWSNMIGTWPPITSMPAAGFDLYGTWFSLMPTSDEKYSPARCPVEPMPAVAQPSWPGRALAKATSSFTVFTGTDGCTTSTCGAFEVPITGVKSRKMS